MDFVDDPVVKFVIQRGSFDFASAQNTVFLPVSEEAARKLGISAYADRPLDSYLQGIRDAFAIKGNAPAFALAQEGDENAVKRVESAFAELCASMRGLLRGKLFVAPGTPKDEPEPDSGLFNRLIRRNLG